MEKAQVVKFHKAVDEVLKNVAREHGFIFKPGHFRYSSTDIRGKMEFILAGKEKEHKEKKTITWSPFGFKAGDNVYVVGNKDVQEFTRRGSAIIVRKPDGKILTEVIETKKLRPVNEGTLKDIIETLEQIAKRS